MVRPRSGPRVRSLRTRVRDAIALVTVVALLLFGIPLAIVLDRLIESQALAGLQRDATRGVASVPDNTLEAGSFVRAPRSTGDTNIGVYDGHGTRIVGRGPAHSPLAALVGDGREHDGHDGGDLSVVVPVLSDTTVAGSVRAAVPLSLLRSRVYRAWSLLAALAMAVVAVSVLLARRAARRISVPFEQITAAARNLGGGHGFQVQAPNFQTVVPNTGVLAVGPVLERTFTVTLGNYAYFCTFSTCGGGHGQMTGDFTVGEREPTGGGPGY